MERKIIEAKRNKTIKRKRKTGAEGKGRNLEEDEVIRRYKRMHARVQKGGGRGGEVVSCGMANRKNVSFQKFSSHENYFLVEKQ